MDDPLGVVPTKVAFTLSVEVDVELFDKAYPTPRDREKAVLAAFRAIVLPNVTAAALDRFLRHCKLAGVKL